ncbi:MAG: hypothetical protein WBQ08_02120, partial [Candidatus Sulfotelmatobacter sp.]
MRESPLRWVIVGAALVLMLFVFDGNPVQKFTASRKTIAEAQISAPSSANRLGEENVAGAQPLPEPGAPPATISSTAPTAPAINAPAGTVAAKSPPRVGLVKTSSASRVSSPASGATLELAVQHQ